MATPFRVELVTPERVLYSGDAEEVSMRTDVGEIAFLAHHEDFAAAVDVTVCTVSLGESTEGRTERFAVHGGFVHFADNTATILASVAEPAAEIDVERARAALAAAERPGEERPEEGAEEGEGELTPTALALLRPDAPEVAARRARVRLETAGATPGG